MNPELAKRLLGINPDDQPADIPQLVKTRILNAQKRVDAAESEAERTRHETTLSELQRASSVLDATLIGSTLADPGVGGDSDDPLPTIDDKAGAGTPGSAGLAGTLDEPATGKLDLHAGTLLAGRYEIRDRIGIGGMGAVFKAFDQDRREEVAVKVPLPGLLHRTVAQERFHSEAKLSSALTHPNIVNVFDVQREGKTYFLTMELLKGKNLREAMLVRGRTKQLYSVEEASHIVSRVCEALHYAHQTTVHRDVKPENVFLCEDGTVKLMDFGIARAVAASDLTKTGSSMGTAYYMAPEQLRDSKDVDHRADQYSVGVMLYELLAGFVPAGRHEPLHRLRKEVSKRLSDVVDRALAPRPEARFGTTDDLRQALVANAKSKAGVPGGWQPWALGAAAIAGVLLLVTQLGGGGDTQDDAGAPGDPGVASPALVADIQAEPSTPGLTAEQSAVVEQAAAARRDWLTLMADQPEGLMAQAMGQTRDPEDDYLSAQDDLQKGRRELALDRLRKVTRNWRTMHSDAQALLARKVAVEGVLADAQESQADWAARVAAGAEASLLGGADPLAQLSLGQRCLDNYDYAGAESAFSRARDAWLAAAETHEEGKSVALASRAQRLDGLLGQAKALDSALDTAEALADESLELGAAFEVGVTMRFASPEIQAARTALTSANRERDAILAAADFDGQLAGLEEASQTLRTSAAEVNRFVADWSSLLGSNSKVGQLRDALGELPLDALGLTTGVLLEPVAAQRANATPLLRAGKFEAAKDQLLSADQLLLDYSDAQQDLAAAAQAKQAWNTARAELLDGGLELSSDPYGPDLDTLRAAFSGQDAAAGRAALVQLRDQVNSDLPQFQRVEESVAAWKSGTEAWEQLHPARRTAVAEQGIQDAWERWSIGIEALSADSADLVAAADQLEQAGSQLRGVVQAAGAEGPILVRTEPATGTFAWNAIPELALEFDVAPTEVWISGTRAQLDGTIARLTPALTDHPAEGLLRWRAVGQDGMESSDLLGLEIIRSTFEDWAEIVRMQPDGSLLRRYIREPLEKTGLPWRVIEPKSGIELLLLPAGRYPRGLSQGDESGAFDEQPRHSVRVPEPFYMGLTEVTRAQWARVMGGEVDEGSGDLPVTDVSPSEIATFLGLTGFALPRESEWEFACRSGTTEPTYGELPQIAWTADNAGGTLRDVAGKSPNLYGLYDMLGNAAELCSNSYEAGLYQRCVESSEGATAVEFDDTATGTEQAVRGGSFQTLGVDCRVSARSAQARDVGSTTLGFRVVRRR